VAGVIGVPGLLDTLDTFLEPTFADSRYAHDEPTEGAEWVGLAAGGLVAIFAVAAAYVLWVRRRGIPLQLRERFPAVHRFLVNKWYFDEIYDALLVQPALRIGRFFWKKGDGATIDGLGADNIAARAQDMAGVLMRFQSGYLYHYAFVMLVGVAALVTYFMFVR
jgi:NADH-quinone oxidoreductase subunit L